MPSAVGVIVLYAVTLLLPGALLGVLTGLRGWTLAAAAPLLTYTLAGLAGPRGSAMGLRWSAALFAVTTLLVGAAGIGLRLVLRRRWPPPERSPTGPDWSITAHAGVAVAVLVALGVGIAAILGGIGSLSAIPQDWDAVYHAAGIRQGPFHVEMALPSAVDADRVEARYERGLLRITLPERTGGG